MVQAHIMVSDNIHIDIIGDTAIISNSVNELSIVWTNNPEVVLALRQYNQQVLDTAILDAKYSWELRKHTNTLLSLW